MLHAILGRLRRGVRGVAKGIAAPFVAHALFRLLQAHNLTVRGTIDVYRYMGGVAAWQVGALGAARCASSSRVAT